jgi:hypothetical protein
VRARYAPGLLLALLLALLLPLGGCGGGASGDGDGDGGDGSSSGRSPSGSSSASGDAVEAAWNPCRDLSAGRVGAALGAAFTLDTGTAEQPRCAFLPVEEGGPTLNVTYLWFDGGLDEAFSSMGRVAGEVTELRVPGADAARLVVNADRRATLVTGFVQTGGLIETVNAAQLAPSDPRAVVRATRAVLATLVEHAPASPGAAARAAAPSG